LEKKMIAKFSVLLRRFTAILLLIAALVFFNSSAVNAQTTVSSAGVVKSSTNVLSVKERVEVFEEVWNAINEKYYDPKFNGTDWSAVHDRYRPRVDTVKSDSELYDLLALMVGELRDAHTRVRSPRARQERKSLQATSAGIRIYEVEGTPVVFSVTPDSDAARAGLVAGMVVQTIDGQPIDEAVAKARREIGMSSSERATRLLSYSRLVAGEPDTPIKLGLKRTDGTPFEITLKRRTVSAAPQFEARLLPSGYAYIKFNRFLPPVNKQIKEALIKFKNAPGLILDLRANGGGDGETGIQIGGYFFNDKISFGRIITRTGKPPSAFFGLFKLPKEFKAGKKGGQIFSNPMVVLINEATGSTSELFASALQEQNRAQIIGTQSCGCVLGVLNYKQLKGGGDLSISEIGFITSKGRTLEGNGVMPGKSVAVTLETLQSQRDIVLEEAEKYFERKENK
jgi:carboxyl-terminal processing protease